MRLSKREVREIIENSTRAVKDKALKKILFTPHPS